MILGGRRFLLGSAVVAAGAFLALAVSLPVLWLAKPVFFAQAHSVISAVNALVRSNQWVLAGVLLVFALLLPLLKLLYLVLLAMLPQAELARSAGQLRALEWLGRWSPHDALAILLTLAFVATHDSLARHAAIGGYLYAAAMLLTMLATLWLRREAGTAQIHAAAPRAAYTPATRGPAFSVLLGLAAGAFALGVTLPVLRLSRAYAGADTYSLAELLWTLHARGETFLWVVILALAVVLPGLRLLYLLTLVLSRLLPHGLRRKAVLAVEALVGPHATADTAILAMMLFYLIAAGAADALLQPGVYCLAASVFLTLLAYAWANILASAPGQGSSLTARLAGLTSVDTPDMR